jgi:hypothetical protein
VATRLEDVYNQDESGVFWRQMPTRTLATGKSAGRKKDKEGATFSLCVNGAGTHKLDLFVIGKAARPRSFPMSFQPKRDLNVRYTHNKTAWMTASEYAAWIRGVDSDMKRKHHRSVMLTDNAPTHMVTDADVEEEHGKVINLSHLKLVFLPANTTSVVQPLDQGITACTKAHCRRNLVQWVIAEAEKPESAGKSLKDLHPTFYQMTRWLNTAWKESVSPLSIRNCWHKAGILPEGWIAAPTGTNAQCSRAVQEALMQPDA